MQCHERMNESRIKAVQQIPPVCVLCLVTPVACAGATVALSRGVPDIAPTIQARIATLRVFESKQKMTVLKWRINRLERLHRQIHERRFLSTRLMIPMTYVMTNSNPFIDLSSKEAPPSIAIG